MIWSWKLTSRFVLDRGPLATVGVPGADVPSFWPSFGPSPRVLATGVVFVPGMVFVATVEPEAGPVVVDGFRVVDGLTTFFGPLLLMEEPAWGPVLATAEFLFRVLGTTVFELNPDGLTGVLDTGWGAVAGAGTGWLANGAGCGAGMTVGAGWL